MSNQDASALILLAELPVSKFARADEQKGELKARGYVLLWQLVPANLQLLLVVHWR